MNNNIVRAFKGLWSQLKRFAAWAKPKIQQVFARSDSASSSDIPSAIPEVAPETTSHPRLAALENKILVQCASCGVIHELGAVCHRCSQPLCSDTQNCRLSVYNADMDRVVVVCPPCRAEFPSAQ